jgi:hypothetical protein
VQDDSSMNRLTAPTSMILRNNLRSVVRICCLGYYYGARNASNGTAWEWNGKDAERGSVAAGLTGSALLRKKRDRSVANPFF